MKFPKFSNLKKKLTVAAVSAAMACNALAITSFAEGSTVSSDYGSYYQTAANAIKSGLVTLVDNTITVAADIVPIGLAIFGMGWVCKKIKSFFVKVS